MLEPHVPQRRRAPAVLLLLADRKELVTLARHELERPPFREPHVHPLEELELARKFSMSLRLHRRVLLVPKA